jgi:energy-coupling factor transporter ATP-binding protein EcfA2
MSQNNVDVKDNITALVGKTGTGKTSFLKLLNSFNKENDYKEAELPNGSPLKNNYTNNSVKSDSILMVKLTFEFQSDLPKAISSLIGETDNISISRFFDGHYEIEYGDKILKEGTQNYLGIIQKFRSEIEALKADINEAQRRIPQIQNVKDNILNSLEQFLSSDFRNPNEVNLAIQTLQNNLNSLPKDPPFQNQINQRLSNLRTSKDELVFAVANDPVRKVVEELPEFTYLSDPFQLEESFSADDFIKNPSQSQTFHYVSVLGSMLPSGVQKVRTRPKQEIDSYFAAISRELSKKVNEYLNLGYNFKVTLKEGRSSGTDLMFMVEDEKTGSTVSVSEMSEGQKWWVAFYLYLSYLGSQGDRSRILLLDNPATALHDEGKGEVLHFLTKMAETGKLQIIYATHERALIDPWRLDRVLLVTKEADGTMIKSMQQGGRGDLIEAIRRHIGSPAKYSLFGAPYNVFVEGISDLNYISAFNELLERKNMECLNKDVYSINAINGIDESVHFNALLKALKLNFLIVLDSNSSKIEEIKRKVGPEDFDRNFLELKGAINREGDIEDLFNITTYYELVKTAYPNPPEQIPPLDEVLDKNQKSKMTKIFNDILGSGNSGYNKTLVSYQAFSIIKDEMKFSAEPLGETLENFSKLIGLIKKKFSQLDGH